MSRAVTLIQLGECPGPLSPADPAGAALLAQVVSGFARPGGTAASVALDVPGGTLVVAGSGLSVGLDGQLAGGTVAALTWLDPWGGVLAVAGSSEPGGLSLAVEALAAAFRDPAALQALVAGWAIAFSAEALPAPTDPDGAGVTFEGAAGGDALTGSAFADVLRGAGGDDRLGGGAGDDVLWGDGSALGPSGGAAGADTLDGGAGDDILRGEGGGDTLRGGDGADWLHGDEDGGTGDDRLDGGAGSDMLLGGLGDDEIAGGSGRDTFVFLDHVSTGVLTLDLRARIATGQGTDTVAGVEDAWGAALQSNVLIGNGAGNRFVGGWQADTLSGLAGDDRLHGDDGADVLRGGDGDDVLCGSLGRDFLSGGAGADAFLLDFAGAGHADRLSDFDAAEDRIWLTGAAAAGLSGTRDLPAAAFRDLSTGPADANDRVLYDPGTGRLWVDADASGPGGRALVALLDPGTVLTAAAIALRTGWDIDDFL